MINKSQKKHNVLLLYKEFTPSVYLCGYLQLEFLKKNNYINFRYSSVNHVVPKDLAWCEIVFLIRSDSFLEKQITKKCKRNGKFVIYVLDDDLLNVPLYIKSGLHYSRHYVRKQIKGIMMYSSALASPSYYLLKKYERICPRTISLIEPASFIIDEKRKWDDGKIHIGFAGSVDRGRDIDVLLTDVLIEISQKYKDRISIEFFGVCPKVSQSLNLQSYPYESSYKSYQEKMLKLNWDIGLAPMPVSEFHSCKYYNKFVEYSGLGIAGIYSKTIPYIDIVENEVNGILCGNTKQEWIDSLTKLIEDTRLRKEISQNVLSIAKSKLSVETAAIDLLKQLPKEKIYLKSEWGYFPIKWYKFCNAIIDTFEKIQKYGIKAPYKAIFKMTRLIKGTVK